MHLLYFKGERAPRLSHLMEDCPLCAHEVEALRYPEDPWIVDEIQSRSPDWRPEQGICSTCLKQIENPFRP